MSHTVRAERHWFRTDGVVDAGRKPLTADGRFSDSKAKRGPAVRRIRERRARRAYDAGNFARGDAIRRLWES
jgi:hypothetical protein